MIFTTKIKEIIDETHDVKTFRLFRPKGLEFTAGQFCLLSLPGRAAVEGESPPFTFSSSPSDTDHIDLTIKRMGVFTGEMFSMVPGEEVVIDGPKGERLNFDDSVQENVVFVAGGSGITPFMSAIRYAEHYKLANKIVLFYANKTRADIIFREELESIMTKPWRKMVSIIGQPEPGWSGEVGRINKDLIKKNIYFPKDWLWYLCGPPGMVAATKSMLVELGVSERNLRIEPWELPNKG